MRKERNLISKAFQGTSDYIASEELIQVVNVAVALERPLLIKGEPGTGKTLLARAIADGLEMDLIPWHIKSTTKAKDGLYVYDAVQRLHDSRFQDKNVSDIKQYIRLGPLGQSFLSEKRSVLLIDEIDKADIEFPNDLLHELDAMTFRIHETDENIKAKQRPVVVITSNNEKELPDAFLRRAVFHFIAFPDRELMTRIVNVHFENLGEDILNKALDVFFSIRSFDAVRKPPSTSELIDWISALLMDGVSPDSLEKRVPYLGVLLKREGDLQSVIRAIEQRIRAKGNIHWS